MSSVVRGDGVSVAVDRHPEEVVGEDAAVAQGTSSPGYHSSIPNLQGGGHKVGAGPSVPQLSRSPTTHPPAASASSSSSSSSSSWAHWLSSLAEGGGGSSSVQLTAGGFTACPSFLPLAPAARKDAGAGAAGRGPHHRHPCAPCPPIPPPYRAQPGRGVPAGLGHPSAGEAPRGGGSRAARRDGGRRGAPHRPPRWCCKPAPRRPRLRAAPSGRCSG